MDDCGSSPEKAVVKLFPSAVEFGVTLRLLQCAAENHITVPLQSLCSPAPLGVKFAGQTTVCRAL